MRSDGIIECQFGSSSSPYNKPRLENETMTAQPPPVPLTDEHLERLLQGTIYLCLPNEFNSIIRELQFRRALSVRGPDEEVETVIKLVLSIANSTHSKECNHDIILNKAADLLNSLTVKTSQADIRAQTIEECAKVADEFAEDNITHQVGPRYGAVAVANRIRALLASPDRTPGEAK